jgi:hypothetical protein
MPSEVTTGMMPLWTRNIGWCCVGTDRNRNARKVRHTYCFSKDWDIHDAVTYFTLYSYNFGWPVRTLRIRDPQGHWQNRTPAMSAGVSDHVWSLWDGPTSRLLEACCSRNSTRAQCW